MQSWEFKNKAKTLKQLRGSLSYGEVLPLLVLPYHSFKICDNDYFQDVFTELNANRLVVRSSYSCEDSAETSMAGMFTSILDITTPDSLIKAIEDVFSSYPQGFSHAEEVLIQPMAMDIENSGVIFTCDPNSGASYYVISNDTSGRTNTVTSGMQGEVETYFLKKNVSPEFPLIKVLLPLANELITGFNNHHLDIEYGIDKLGKIYLFQVRPLCTNKVIDLPSPLSHLESISKKLEMLMKPHPFLYGKTTVFGVMPDWNPAEIIGLYPKTLALSLYKILVTDSIWAYQRNNYGYKNLRSFPLMIDFLGLPYIDVRVSFNSFLPKDIGKNLGHKLVDYYLDCLKANPKAHDSVEFDIVLSCYTPSIKNKMNELVDAGFTDGECSELASHLLQLTNRIIDPRTGLWIQDLHRIEKLKKLHVTTKHGFIDPVSRIYWQLENCKRYGTLPFAGLARAAFIAVQLLQSLKEESVLSQQDYDQFLSSLNTVSGTMQEDLVRLSKEDFLTEYGHLRPGTYDICSPRYDMTSEKYFDWEDIESNYSSTIEQLKFSPDVYEKINRLLSQHGINHSAYSLLHFIKCAIEGREYAKFVFTQSLSDALEDFALLGDSYGYKREDMAYFNANLINQLMTGSDSQFEVIRDSINAGKELYKSSSLIKLPPLINSSREAYEFKISECEPSYITRKKVIATVANCIENTDFKDKIILITSADPGYDWIFSHKIKGFITAFGGCNSHMAIRAVELNIPAVIGAGEFKFNQWAKAKVLELDCESHCVRVVK
ncbi:PEP/pyruvate-binding domain-containing protein [Shewanella morhuae]|uniref:Uncharacterized protein conserved in bacteria n=1 Tax=Shewanella morhuae TaxID=365591 RepID=A0A380A8K1_9GAMM|nr:PEP/pyruvate-binding domain-containing protein [Shewanella morhuae]SUI76024.1 Uncharacterized protein conserved in bacteria [Shewanella morhuae]